jgi:hypothetical protein
MTTLDVSLENTLGRTPLALAGSPSRRRAWGGRMLTGLALVFLTWDTVLKLMGNPMAVEGTTALGFPPHTVQMIGVIEALCLVLYVVPRTAVLGAVVWTGYLGGAIATHVRLENPLFTHTLFPIYIAAMLWGGLALRDKRVTALLSRPEERSRPESVKTPA